MAEIIPEGQESPTLYVTDEDLEVTIVVEETPSIVLTVAESEQETTLYVVEDEELEALVAGVDDEVHVISILTEGPPGGPGIQGETGATGPAGPPGPGIEKLQYNFAFPSDEWHITHTLPFDRPDVNVYDTNGDIMEADITFPSSTEVVVRFAYETTGMVQLG